MFYLGTRVFFVLFKGYVADVFVEVGEDMVDL